MKKLLTACILFPALAAVAMAAIIAPFPDYFEGSDTVCLARVASVDNRKVSFEITGTLRGDAGKALVLNNVVGIEFKPGSEWLLMSFRNPGHKDESVGWYIKGSQHGWLPVAVMRHGGETEVEGLTLENIRRLLLEHPCKPE